jgi:hypothetical protein
VRCAADVTEVVLLEGDDLRPATGEVIRGGAAERPHAYDGDFE